MKTITITFLTHNAPQLTEGIIQMITKQIDTKTFEFELEEEEVDMLLEEIMELGLSFSQKTR